MSQSRKNRNHRGQQGVDRRTLLKQAGLGALSSSVLLEQLAGVPGIFTGIDSLRRLGFAHHPYDAYANLRSALQGGPAFGAVSQAMAQDDDGWILVQIKVVNHIYSPMVFAMGKEQDGAVELDPTAEFILPTKTQMVGTHGVLDTGTGLTAQVPNKDYFEDPDVGLNELTDIPRMRKLRFNKWFASMLQNGTADGKTPDADNLLRLEGTDVEPLNENTVAVQAFTGLGRAAQVATLNHALIICKLRPTLSDLPLFCQERKIIASPLGISCFMMGNAYDKAEGTLFRNAVLQGNRDNPNAENAAIASRTVSDYFFQIKQYVGKTYADREPIETPNLIYQMDQLVAKDPHLRRELLSHMEGFKASIESLGGIVDLELLQQSKPFPGGGQSQLGKQRFGSAPTSEFLAQCKFVATASEITGKPIRNFSLFLNCSDLDGNSLDSAVINAEINEPIKAYSYVEGMRQLAMGLNVLGKKIAAGKKIMVVVTSEGGRTPEMSDAKTSFALVMGPKGAGMLDDKLFANMEQFNALTSNFIRNPGAEANARPWEAGAMVKGDGSAFSAAEGQPVPNPGDVQMGVARFLAEKQGVVGAFAGLDDVEARYVKLAKK